MSNKSQDTKDTQDKPDRPDRKGASQSTSQQTNQADTDKSKTSKESGDSKAVRKASHIKSHRRDRGKHRILFALILFVLLAVLALGGYYAWRIFYTTKHAMEQRIVDVDQQLSKLNGRIKKLDTANAKQLDSLHQQQTLLQNNLSTLLNRNVLLRKDWLIAEAEYLIKLANHRLLLEKDISTSIAMLNSADERLREISDPALITMRKHLAEDIGALQAVPQPDITGMSLAISALIMNIEKLPLSTPDPKTIKHKIESEAKENQGDRSGELLTTLWQDIKDLVVMRDHSQPVRPLLTPGQRYFLTQNLRLQLEQVRYALLHGNSAIYKERISVSQDWIGDYFDAEATITKTMLEKLADLIKQDISPPIPDINSSYNAILDYRARIVRGNSSSVEKSNVSSVTSKPGLIKP